MKGRSLLGSQKLLRRRRILKGFKIALIIALLLVFFWGISQVAAAPQLTVQHIIVSGNSVIPTDKIVADATNELQGKYFWFFPRANTFWYPKDEILDRINFSYAWLDAVSIKKLNLTTIEIKIKERVPVAVWCGLQSSNPAPCKLVDAAGLAFAPAPTFSGPAYIRLYGPLTSASARGAVFFSHEGLVHMLSLTKGMTQLGIQPMGAEVVLQSAKDEYTVVLASGARIAVQVSDSVSSILSNLQSLLTQKAFAQSALRNYNNLTSIDMRFGNKIFYKFKDEVSAASTATATSSKI